MSAAAGTASLVGREADIEALCHHLAGPGVVAITGCGGLGKTSLAMAVLQTLEQAGDRTLVCPLAGARDAADLLDALTFALNLPAADSGRFRRIAALGRALSARGRMVVLLDAFESVVGDGGCDVVTQLAELARETVFVVTSREWLGIEGSTRYLLAPLSTEADAEGPSPAATLFYERAARARRLERTPELDAQVEQIVERLDGIPLAIELAAARTAVLTMTQLVERFAKGLGALHNPGRGASRRHRTMREVLEASWSLLPEDGQRAFAQLAVFNGPFDLAAAESVLRLGETSTVDALQMLVQASLLNVSDDEGGLRYTMFDVIGALAVEKARAEPAEEAATWRRFVGWYLDHDPLDDLAAMLDRTTPRLLRLARDERQYFAIHHRALKAETPDHVTAARALFRVFPLITLRAAEPLHLACYEQLAMAWPEAPTDGSEGRWRLAYAVLRLTQAVLQVRGGTWTELLGCVESLAGLALYQASATFRAVVLWYEAQGASALGDAQRSIDCARAAVEVGLGGDDAAIGVAGYALLTLSQTQIEQNRLEEGRQSSERALAIARERGDFFLLSRAASGLAVALRGLRR
ncbi:MAG: AAA family ATPase, partial [Myxococcales bacterium]|nr:AAA family ATPase [Myxococcales bacterium]